MPDAANEHIAGYEYLAASRDRGHSLYAVATETLMRLNDDDQDCILVPQVLYEFWVVATRPIDVNGLELSVDDAKLAIEKWMTAYRILLDEPGIYQLWESLVMTHQVKGKPAHDARLVAAMQQHQVTKLLTFNVRDFDRFPEISVYSPQEILTGKLN